MGELRICCGPSARTEQSVQLTGRATAQLKLVRERFPELSWILHLYVIDNLAIIVLWFTLLWRNQNDFCFLSFCTSICHLCLKEREQKLLQATLSLENKTINSISSFVVLHLEESVYTANAKQAAVLSRCFSSTGNLFFLL